MKIQSLLALSIICFFCTGVFAEDAAPVTGLCKDGTPYTGKSKRGACRGHDGVKEWYADKTAATSTPASTTPPSAAAAPAPVVAAPTATKTTEPTKAAGPATGLCKDGTEYTGASKRGACRGHKGVKEWYADKQTATAAPEAKAAPAATPATATPPPAQTTTPTPVAPAPKAAPVAAAPAPAPAAGSGQVWVNTKSKVYHCEGTKFYGKTKEGEYMSEADAIAKGIKANRNKACN